MSRMQQPTTIPISMATTTMTATMTVQLSVQPASTGTTPSSIPMADQQVLNRL